MQYVGNEIVKHWADFFGVSRAALFDGKTHVVPHSALAGYHGAWIFRRGNTSIISVPETMVGSTTATATALPILTMTSESVLKSLFHERIQRFIGPAYQGFVSRANFKSNAEQLTTLAGPEDGLLLRELASACGETDWDHSSIDIADDRIFISVSDRVPVAAASAKVVDGIYPNLGVATHPARRGKGYGTAVAAAAIADALTRHPVVLWQTLIANTGSITLAERLGFTKFAESFAVRLILDD